MKWEFDDKINYIVSQDTLLVYPDLNNKIDINTGTSDFQLGTVMIKRRRTIMFYICNFTGPHTNTL